MKEEKFSLPPEILEAMELTNESNYTPEQLLAYDKYLGRYSYWKKCLGKTLKKEALGKLEKKQNGRIKLKSRSKVEKIWTFHK
ncbi:MAG: hypothetical protein IPL23_24210 [Saprospiraceae bacterium]|nr:hypothetical protein [Saprospiraceae bacterium]